MIISYVVCERVSGVLAWGIMRESSRRICWQAAQFVSNNECSLSHSSCQSRSLTLLCIFYPHPLILTEPKRRVKI